MALDVGAGSGRDAQWLADRGWDVIAVEPASAMRLAAMRAHGSPAIRWIDDRLPALASVHRLGLAFDMVWLSGVWMHVEPPDRPRAMRKLATLLKPGGRLVLTLRHGPAPEDRPMWPVDSHEVERLGLDVGLALRVATEHADDLDGRSDVRWQTIILDLPDDGVGALPLLRGVILRQEKAATYKLGLLRCIARIADASPNVARDAGDHVDLPLGLIALYWIRMFKPLVERRLPQRPGDAMGFVTAAFNALQPIAAFDLRPGMVFADGLGEALRRALADTAKLIERMPAHHLTFADDMAVFPTRYGRIPAGAATIMLDQAFLWQYGTTSVPLNIWNALRRMSAWIEPMLIAEWVRLTQVYADRQGRQVSADDVMTALRWVEPKRDTTLVRGLALKILARGEMVRCVWSGRPLGADHLDIDHCLPWSAWACADLWNLLPSGSYVNRHNKGEKIIAGPVLAQAKPLILDWWREAYLEGDHIPRYRSRFIEEAQTTLPLPMGECPDLEQLFQAVDFRRLRLRQDTQAPEWAGIQSP
jgi:hypothetical protein